jgi:carboxyl-terminal processing protease
MSLYKKSPDAFTVVTVLPDAPAAEAGVAVGDEVVAINGTAATQLSGWDMRRIVRQPPGTRLSLEMIRGGQKRSTVLTLRELLP